MWMSFQSVSVYDYCVCIPFCGYETQITVKLQNNMHIFKHIHIYPELFTPMMARPVVVFLEGERGREGVEREPLIQAGVVKIKQDIN